MNLVTDMTSAYEAITAYARILKSYNEDKRDYPIDHPLLEKVTAFHIARIELAYEAFQDALKVINADQSIHAARYIGYCEAKSQTLKAVETVLGTALAVQVEQAIDAPAIVLNALEH